jgi:hypothetical protein
MQRKKRVTVGVGPFPLSIEVERRNSVWFLDGVVLSARDLAPLLPEFSGSYAVVLNLFHTSWFDEKGASRPGSNIALEEGVPVEVRYDSAGSEQLLVPTASLRLFFSAFNPVDVDVVDVPTLPSDEELEQIVTAVETAQVGEGSVLSSLERPSIYYRGHDDCYFWIEARTDRLARLVFCRLLAQLVEGALIGPGQAALVPEPHERLAAELLNRSNVWTGTVRTTEDGLVDVALAPAKWRLGGRFSHSAAYSAVFDASAGQWDPHRKVLDASAGKWELQDLTQLAGGERPLIS